MASRHLLTHARRRALRDAALTGGLYRYGLSELHYHPERRQVVYLGTTISALMTAGMLVRVTDPEGRDLAKITTLGLEALQGSWRPAGAEIPPGSIVEFQPA